MIRPLSPNELEADSHPAEDHKEVSEEEAICRICLLGLHEGGETLNLECRCKGGLALAHTACAVKWFSIKGNSNCDICNNQVRNLPVILFRRSSSLISSNEMEEEDNEEDSSWHHAAVIILSSALASLWHKLEELAEFP